MKIENFQFGYVSHDRAIAEIFGGKHFHDAGRGAALGESAEVAELDFGSRNSFSSLRDGAQLLHHPEQIPADPFLYDLSVLDAVDGYTHPSGPFVGRRQAH